MNSEWSELNKRMQIKLKKEDTFNDAIEILFTLRKELMNQILEFKRTLSKEEFCAIPFINADGFHNKTIAYSLYHIFRIEDIVSNSLIKKSNQIFFEHNYQRKMNSPIITTGNELVKEEIADFSNKLDINELYKYIECVNESSMLLLKSLSFTDMKTKITQKDAEDLCSLNAVSTNEKAIWLVDYWCNKDVKGLIQMPFSRHWIMHIEACIRIKNKIS